MAVVFVLPFRTHTHPSIPVRSNRADGLFSVNGSPLALLDVQNSNDLASVKWHLATVRAAEINRDAVLTDYRARAPPTIDAGSVAWSG